MMCFERGVAYLESHVGSLCHFCQILRRFTCAGIPASISEKRTNLRAILHCLEGRQMGNLQGDTCTLK